MTDTLHTIKQRVRELSPYSLKRAKARIKLNQNENPWDAPLRIKEEVLRRLQRTALVAISGLRPGEFASTAGGIQWLDAGRNHRRQRFE